MNCPNVDNLKRLAVGTLDSESVDAIEQHLLDCESCRQNLAEIEKSADDPALLRLRRSEKRSKNSDFLFSKQITIEGFSLGNTIGEGGMGTVYEAVDESNGELRAIKVLHASKLFDPIALARFRREKEAIAKLSHPNIVKSLPSDNSSVIVMERLHGTDLSSYVKKHGPLAVDKARDIILQTATGLEYAHNNGIVHRDIKPSNLFLTDSGTVKILDFGLARLWESEIDAAKTKTDQIIGTPDFLSPEQAIDPKSIDRRSDVYSLGCTLYYILTGDSPFSGKKYTTVGSKIAGHSRDVPPQIRKLRADIPAFLSVVLKKMLEKEPRRRFQTMQEVADAMIDTGKTNNKNKFLLIFLVVCVVGLWLVWFNSSRAKPVDPALVSNTINNVEPNPIADLNRISLPETRQNLETPTVSESRKIRIKYSLSENGKSSFRLEKQDSPMETMFEGEPMLIPEYPKLKAKRDSKGVIQLLYDFADFDRNDPYCGFGNDSGGGWRLEPPHFVLENGVGGCLVNYFEALPLTCQYDIDDWTGNDLFLTVEECTRHLDPNTLQAVNQLSIVDAADSLFFAWQRNRYEKSVKDLLLNTSNRRHSIPFEQDYSLETGTQFKHPASMCYLWQKVGNKRSPGQIKIRRIEIQGKMIEQAEALRRSQLPSKSDSTDRYYRVEGKRILDPNGKPVFIRGVNVHSWLNLTASDADDLKDLNVKYITYILVYDLPNGMYDPNALEPMRRFGKSLKEQIELFTDRGIEVIIAPRSSLPINGKPSLDSPLTDEFILLWKDIIETFKDNHRVIAWNIYHEIGNWMGDWQFERWYKKIVPLIRQMDPHRPLLLSGTHNGDLWHMGDSIKSNDKNIIYQYIAHPEHEVHSSTSDLIKKLSTAVEIRNRFNAPVMCQSWGIVHYSTDSRLIKNMATAFETLELPWFNDAWRMPRERNANNPEFFQRTARERYPLVYDIINFPEKDRNYKLE